MRLPALVLALAVGLFHGEALADLNSAREALEHGDYPRAQTELTALRGAQRAPGDRLQGRLYLETGRYDDALTLGQRLARTPAGRADGLTLQGEALVALGRYDEALQRWGELLARGPEAPRRRARALTVTWLARLGRRDEAREAANPLLDAYNDAVAAQDAGAGPRDRRTAVLRDAEFLTCVGLAARALRSFRDANQAFNDALELSPGRVETNVEQAELMVVTEDLGPAGEALREALRVNPHHARALALRARARLENDLDFVRAREDLDAAAAVNPRLPAVFTLRASIALRDTDFAEVDRQLDGALAVNPRDPEALALRGVARFVADDLPGFRQAFDQAFGAVPAYAEAYEILGDFADWEHRYGEAVDLLREGLQRPGIVADRTLQARLRANLGVNLLRMGREDDGVAELRTSYDQSRFNVRVANLLNFYEQTLPGTYERDEEGPFRVRYHREEHAVLRRYVPQLLRRAYDDMVARYHFTPDGPLSVELYASDEDFSVRTAGLPEIGVQGVCFGRVVTALSPRGGPFNWGQIVWHELAHVFAIQLSRSRVPRWFTEGLSEWEAFHSYPEWAREDDPALYRAMVDGRVPRVADFNTAFTHARRPQDMLVAYYAASKLVEFMIDRYGFDRVVSMLPRWGRGLRTPAVVQEALGVSADVVDREFRAAVELRLRRYAGAFAVDPGAYRERARLDRVADEHPSDAAALSAAAAAALFDGDPERAGALAERASRIDATDLTARWVRARLALSRREGREALAHVDEILRAGRDGYELRLLEAQAARAAGDQPRVLRALQSAVAADPTQVDAHRLLGLLARRAHRDDDRLRALREVVRLDQHDRDALDELLRLLYERRLWGDLRALHDHANQLDPENVAAHLCLAQAALETNARDVAVYEYESALALEGSNAAVRQRLDAVRRGERALPPLPLPARPRPPAEEPDQAPPPGAGPGARPPGPPGRPATPPPPPGGGGRPVT